MRDKENVGEGMELCLHGGCPNGDLPEGVWFNILEFSEGPAHRAMVGAVNRASRRALRHPRICNAQLLVSLSPEYCGSLQTKQEGKDFLSLWGRWTTGKPAGVDVVHHVHRSGEHRASRTFDLLGGINSTRAVLAIKLSQTRALAAWSAGMDHRLVGTDVTTGQIVTSYRAPGRKPRVDDCALLDSVGLVCAGGSHMTGWDPRQKGAGASPTPVFSVDYWKATRSHFLLTMISADSPGCEGSPQLLTGGDGSNVYLWDIRNISRGPVQSFVADGPSNRCLARDPSRGTLLGGGMGSATCWDFKTGAQLSILRTDEQTVITSLAAGKERIVTGDNLGVVAEWAVPDPKDEVGEQQPLRVRALADLDNHGIMTTSMQGLGEGPDRVLAGTKDGSICMWECGEDPEQLPLCWSLGAHSCRGAKVTCLAAVDEVVVNSFSDGSMRTMQFGN